MCALISLSRPLRDRGVTAWSTRGGVVVSSDVFKLLYTQVMVLVSSTKMIGYDWNDWLWLVW
jgi:hypothetical protein